MIDVDYLEVCKYCKEPLFLAEVARDVGQDFKATTIIRRLAARANLPAFLIFCKDEIIKGHVKQTLKETSLLETDDEKPMPTLSENQLKILWGKLAMDDRQIIRLVQVYPQSNIDKVTAKGFYDFVRKMHNDHELGCPIQARKLVSILDAPFGSTYG